MASCSGPELDKNTTYLDAKVHQSSEISEFKEVYNKQLSEFFKLHADTPKKPWTTKRITEVIEKIKHAVVSTQSGQRKTSMEYYWSSKYEVLNINNTDFLVLKRLSPDDPTTIVVPVEGYFDLLYDTHNECKHGGRDKILNLLRDRFYIQKKAIEIFVSLCPMCSNKRITKKKFVTDQTGLTSTQSHGHLSLIDLQSTPDGNYKWLLNYQDKLTKFLHLRPLHSAEATEVALELNKIFLIFGPPSILESNQQEFTTSVIEEISKNSPEFQIKPSDENAKESNYCDKIERIIKTWMDTTKLTNWSFVCHFIQFKMNISKPNDTPISPYRAVFGSDPKIAEIPNNILQCINTVEGMNSPDNTQTVVKSQKVDPNNMTDLTNNDQLDQSETSKYQEIEIDVIIKTEDSTECSICLMEINQETQCCSCFKPVHKGCGLPSEDVGYGSKILCLKCKEKLDNEQINTSISCEELKRAADLANESTKKQCVEVGSLDIRNSLQQPNTSAAGGILGLNHNKLAGKDMLGCSCKRSKHQCRTFRCMCFKKKVPCGSTCHPKNLCLNKPTT